MEIKNTGSLEANKKNQREVECSGISKQLETKLTNLTGVGSIRKDQSKVTVFSENHL